MAKGAAVNAGEFKPDIDGLSTWEEPYLPGKKHYIVQFDLYEIGVESVEVPGVGQAEIAFSTIQSLPACYGIQTYLVPVTGHCSVPANRKLKCDRRSASTRKAYEISPE